MRDGSMSGLVEDMQTFAETCWMLGAFLRTGCKPTFDAMPSGTVAEPAFANAGMAVPLARSLALLESGYSGQIVPPGTPADLGAAYLFFRPIGVAGQAASASVETPDDLYAQAQGSGASGSEARQALLALSPFVIAGGGSPAPGAEVTYMSPQYLADRRDMLTARLAFDADDLAYDQTLSQYSVLRGTVFSDVPAGVTLAEDNPLLPGAPRQVRFGGNGSDSLTGGAADDALYGGAGNDTLTGNADHDHLEGGPGVDSYVVVGDGDDIFDTDGQGSINFNGVVLTGGARGGGDLWHSGDGRFTFARSLRADSIDLRVRDHTTSDTLTIRDFISGDLGIVLDDASQAEPPTDTIAPADTTLNGIHDLYNPGSPLADEVSAGQRYDNIWTYQGNDVIHAGSGDDRIYSGSDADWVDGDDGNDYVRAGYDISSNPALIAADSDRIAGGPGTDLLAGGIGDDTIYAG